MRSIPAWAGQPFDRKIVTDLDRVYPRVGGATGQHRRGQTYDAGLSPRGRGNPPRFHGRGAAMRSIPAWAGQP